MNGYRESGLFELRSLRLHLGIREFLITLAIVAGASLAAFEAKSEIGQVAAALVFVLGITLAGAFCGLEQNPTR